MIINYNNSHDKAKMLKEYLEKTYNVTVLVIKCDVSDEKEVINMKNIIIKEFSKVDVLVNNAAVEIVSDVKDKNYDSFKKVFDVNVIGTFLVSKYIGNIMYENKHGKIINISSNNAIDKYDPQTMEYDASKSAIISLTHNFAKEYAPYINVNAIAPGWILTDKVKELDEELSGELIKSESKKILLNRFASCEDISKVVVFLASDDANYINSTVIKIDGGAK